jgi:hypothetical protein
MLDHDVLSLIFNDEIDVSHLLENLNTTLGPVLGLLANFSLAISLKSWFFIWMGFPILMRSHGEGQLCVPVLYGY